MAIQLGDRARDTITGFEGIVIAITHWLHGCTRLTLQPKGLQEGKPIEAQSFDEPQLELRRTTTTNRQAPANGGPRPAPVRRADPR